MPNAFDTLQTSGYHATSGYHGGKYNRMAGVGALTADEASVYVGKH
jgi:hypothetical protein